MSDNIVDDEHPRIDPTALVEATATVGRGSVVWGLSHIRAGARLGSQCVVGRGAFVDAGVVIGDRCKIQNDALLYAPATLADGVFIGPAVVLTNDLHPRAITPDGALKAAADWDSVGAEIRRGASVGARAVCVAPVVVGEWAMVAAGAVVVHDVRPHALVAGVPARQVAWVGRSGHRLEEVGPGHFTCPVTGEAYVERNGELLHDV